MLWRTFVVFLQLGNGTLEIITVKRFSVIVNPSRRKNQNV